ncbi:MAG TPA: cobalt chelatase, partial [Ramlibacter sp.]|nr:cobalt chelatase [Ramlibacter sp.]
ASTPAGVPTGDGRVPSDTQRRDRVFTTAYDTQQQASSLVRPAQLEEYRARLDRAATQLAVNVPRFARELQAALSVPVRGGWDDGLEDGVLDGRRLAQLIASPTERRLFRQPHIAPRTDCAVAFLVDCSASMRERIEPVALFMDTCARGFELAGASCEVLGFTTGAWNGGRALGDWQRAGRPPNPGRLNERRHLIFKDAATPWAQGRGGRRGVAALLKTDLFREGIDGEAVDWACARLLCADARRRILFVLSDGSPMDSATALANDAHYLGDHLREVVLRRQLQGRVEVCGIGIGLDLGTWYRQTFPMDLSSGLDKSVFMDLVHRVSSRSLYQW